MHSFLFLGICTFVFGHKLSYNRMPEVLPSDSHGKYIIKFKDSPSVVQASSFIKAQAAHVSPVTLASISSAQGIEPDQLTYGISSTYNSTFLNAVAVTLSEEDMSKIRKKYKGKIEYIEPDLKLYAAEIQRNAPWGLARIGQWDRIESRSYEYPDAAGEGVDVYVLDSGLIPTHPSFEGRAKFLKDFSGGSASVDHRGHGTMVAGIVGSSIYGVAKKANIYSIKVMGDKGGAGAADFSAVVKGIHLAIRRAKPRKTVINISLSGPKSKAVDDAVAAARKAGVVVVAAAGNHGRDSCNYSPANSPHAITVGATDYNDKIAYFSGWGKCVDIFAPGVRITSLGKLGNDITRVATGTSAATPHVAGIAAVYMSIKSYKNPGDVIKDILANARISVKGAVKGASRRLAYVNAQLE